jgi:hypothetical protein
MRKCIILLVAGVVLCLGQTAPLIIGSETASCNKSLSVELFGGTHLTLEHWMSYRGITLPVCIWGGGGCIRYQPLRHVMLSLSGSYDHARNLAFMRLNFSYPWYLHLTYIETDIQLAYTDVTSASTVYYMGVGMGVSYMRLQEVYVDYTDATSDSLVTNISLSPVVSLGLKIRIADRLYSHLQANCHVGQIFILGEEHMHMGDILPSVSLGLGYTFIK